jgi:hypothetical protein
VVTNPVLAAIVALLVLLLVQVPNKVASLSWAVDPVHRLVDPFIIAGVVITVIVETALQPVASV